VEEPGGLTKLGIYRAGTSIAAFLALLQIGPKDVPVHSSKVKSCSYHFTNQLRNVDFLVSTKQFDAINHHFTILFSIAE